MRSSSRPLLLALLAILVGGVGCYETTFRLGRLADAKVDRTLCGDWDFANLDDPADAHTTLSVRNLDDRQYVLVWQKQGDVRGTQMIGDVADVRGVKFVHARPLREDGRHARSHYLIRFDLDGDTLYVRHLKKEFLERQSITSDATLRGVIETHIDNLEMYEPSQMVGQRLLPE